jgi:hypothetical protein
MLIAADYPFLDVLWSMLVFFAFAIWFLLLIRIFADIFRRHDMSGWAKTGWVILLILLPFLGAFIYLIAHSGDMAERDARQAKAAQAEMDEYVRSVAGSGGAAAEIDRAQALLDRGAINQAEFDAIKAKALAGG